HVVSHRVRLALNTNVQPEFLRIIKYFADARRKFRNPLHHSASAQGYNIAEREVLELIAQLDTLVKLLFPGLVRNGDIFVGGFYLAYIVLPNSK
ncbi:MAG TPA: hypothetical protein VIV15_04075, partial [Anaerolineales bacterium]